jgi:CubicO group peptidase (beta-lactamase class C family)/beta-glucosidase-like glycosyl hydrolase
LIRRESSHPALPAPAVSPRRGRLRRALALALLACAAACGREQPRSPWTEARLARMTTRQKVAQLLVVRAPPLSLAAAPGDSSRARLRRWAMEGLGGVEMTGGPASAATALADSLRRMPLAPLVAARMDGGARAFIGATEFPSAGALMVLGNADLATRVGKAAADEARALGIDLAFVGGPALPADSAALAPPSLSDSAVDAYAAFVHALGEGGRLPAVTAFQSPSPEGDARLRVARWDRSALEVAQLDWLGAAVKAGAAAVQPGWVTLPALTGDTTPLPLSAVTTFGLLRRDLGFGGMVVADVSADGPLAIRGGGPVSAAVAAIREGADLLTGVGDAGAMADSLAAAVEAGRIPRDVVDRAVRRVFAAKRRAGLGVPPADTTRVPLPAREAAATAVAGFERTAVILGPVPALAGCRKPVLISAPGVDVSALSPELARRIPNLLHLRTWAVARHGPLTRVAGFGAADADCAVVAVTPGARPRFIDRIGAAAARDTSKAARRDTAKFRADSIAFAGDTVTRRIALVSLDADPAGPLPAEARTAVLVFGAGERAQRAAARALFGEIRRPADEVPHPRAAWPPARKLVRGNAKDVGMSADSLAKIDAVLERALDGGVFTSAAVAVGRHGKLVKLRGFGTVAGHPVDPANTLFDLASLTKVIGTTAAVMALVDDGRVKLDEPVYRYLPQFRGGGRGDVTIWNLMTHTGGLPAGDDLYGETADPDAALQKVYRTDLVYEPGTKMVYSDFGMILMAEVVRRRAGEPVDRFAARRVFVPLGMENTMYRPPLVWWGRTVPSAMHSERPYVLRDVVHDGNSFRLGGVAGHAGLFSTAGDLAIYAQTLLNLGAYGDRRIWSPRTVQRFTTRQLKVETRALGWDTPARRSSAGDYFSPHSFGHTGYTGTSIWIDPDRDLFVVLLTNRVYDGGTEAQILATRAAVSDAAARAITDMPILPRSGTAAAEARAAAERAAARARARANARKKHPVRRGHGSTRRSSTRRGRH